MKMKKLAVLIIGTMFFWNLYGALSTHLRFEDNFEDSFGDHDGTNYGSTFATGKEGRSIVPHSITLSRTGKIMSEEKAVEELSKSVTIEEANKGRVVYSLDENNELVLSFMTKNEERREFKTISLEAKDE